MDSATQDLLLQRVKEMIFDEEKPVTCLTLAAELKITLSDSKALLQTFVEDCRRLKQHRLHVTYLLHGSCRDGKLSIRHVNEEKLEEAKESFDVVTLQVVFSVQKGENTDPNVIVLVNSACKLSSDMGVVKGAKCIQRPIKTKTLPVTQTTTENASLFKKFEEKSKVSSKEVGKSVSQSQSKAKGGGGIANFFSMAAKKSEKGARTESGRESAKGSSEELMEVDVKKIEKSKGDSPKNVDAKENGEELMEVDVKKIGTSKENSQKNVDATENNEELMEVDVKKIGTAKENSRKKRKKSSKENESNKRRKRIQEICSSDSDIFDEDDNEDIIEASFEEPVHVPVVQAVPAPKNKRRKTVDKSYTDEEGFIVTTTEYVYESASDEENKQVNTEETKKVEVAKSNVKTEVHSEVRNGKGKGKKNKKPVTGKQPTLMSFFKKN